MNHAEPRLATPAEGWHAKPGTHHRHCFDLPYLAPLALHLPIPSGRMTNACLHLEPIEALFSYEAAHDDELSLTRGEPIHFVHACDDGWILVIRAAHVKLLEEARPRLSAEYGACLGWVPSNYTSYDPSVLDHSGAAGDAKDTEPDSDEEEGMTNDHEVNVVPDALAGKDNAQIVNSIDAGQAAPSTLSAQGSADLFAETDNLNADEAEAQGMHWKSVSGIASKRSSTSQASPDANSGSAAPVSPPVEADDTVQRPQPGRQLSQQALSLYDLALQSSEPNSVTAVVQTHQNQAAATDPEPTIPEPLAASTVRPLTNASSSPATSASTPAAAVDTLADSIHSQAAQGNVQAAPVKTPAAVMNTETTPSSSMEAPGSPKRGRAPLPQERPLLYVDPQDALHKGKQAPAPAVTDERGVVLKTQADVRRHCVIAEFDCDAEEADELAFCKGDVIVLLQADLENPWWEGYRFGETRESSGLFPSHYIRRLSPHEAQFLHSMLEGNSVRAPPAIASTLAHGASNHELPIKHSNHKRTSGTNLYESLALPAPRPNRKAPPPPRDQKPYRRRRSSSASASRRKSSTQLTPATAAAPRGIDEAQPSEHRASGSAMASNSTADNQRCPSLPAARTDQPPTLPPPRSVAPSDVLPPVVPERSSSIRKKPHRKRRGVFGLFVRHQSNGQSNSRKAASPHKPRERRSGPEPELEQRQPLSQSTHAPEVDPVQRRNKIPQNKRPVPPSPADGTLADGHRASTGSDHQNSRTPRSAPKPGLVERDYRATCPDELTLHAGATVTVLDTTTDDRRWRGRDAQGCEGWFPADVVQLIQRRSRPASILMPSPASS
ncbi:uncharacterized protein MONBRDRAFT_10841 [Monosiga brevicollis MX1]|uniref:SH3 domain-containing protein n=1 Tax=Monosiga brevicollis TaxID=81824 RepID=A9V7E3_MONBE|nr:uncharacterized protein MONBRDRAFT_10841 [Monosiga brevicollis MX1]EDQ86570.1 predicted protein [Monosiga brevicollis MX1]|eukprot:XP_001748683.1 hypothetical protein [Monosiga brevicollis MX1]